MLTRWRSRCSKDGAEGDKTAIRLFGMALSTTDEVHCSYDDWKRCVSRVVMLK